MGNRSRRTITLEVFVTIHHRDVDAGFKKGADGFHCGPTGNQKVACTLEGYEEYCQFSKTSRDC
jgi:hypothetical protein